MTGAACRGKLITCAENHIITVDPFLKYQVGAPYEAMREFNGKLFGAAGRTIHHVLEWWTSQKVRAWGWSGPKHALDVSGSYAQ